jgi:hypothetical protein
MIFSAMAIQASQWPKSRFRTAHLPGDDLGTGEQRIFKTIGEPKYLEHILKYV